MAIRSIAVVLGCLAVMGHSQFAESSKPDSTFDDGLASLAMLLLELSPAAAFNPVGGRAPMMPAKRALTRAATPQLKTKGQITVDAGLTEDEIEELLSDWSRPSDEENDYASDQVISEFNEKVSETPFDKTLRLKREYLNPRNLLMHKNAVKKQKTAELGYDFINDAEQEAEELEE
mmetsp:Transcript_118607/g.209641  ORF Transcript_118607/g.209641 Transcript_118607/m.209641 type:complete len:176 (-) Transcript_118607:164-691(-)